jgi:autophagy-related protein 9
MRTWSQYGKLYLRHFNELDHELEARLNRAYRPAVKFMDSFSSPLMTVMAKFVIFTFGGFGAFIAILTIIDEDVIQVEHVLTLLTFCITAAVLAASLIHFEGLPRV